MLLFKRAEFMSSRVIPVPALEPVVFGPTGDLSLRSVFLVLFRRLKPSQRPDAGRIVSATRGNQSDAFWRGIGV
jgi:glucose-6-phosphate 1-dehydrogenase